jgi:hypothetical protein
VQGTDYATVEDGRKRCKCLYDGGKADIGRLERLKAKARLKEMRGIDVAIQTKTITAPFAGNNYYN